MSTSTRLSTLSAALPTSTAPSERKRKHATLVVEIPCRRRQSSATATATTSPSPLFTPLPETNPLSDTQDAPAAPKQDPAPLVPTIKIKADDEQDDIVVIRPTKRVRRISPTPESRFEIRRTLARIRANRASMGSKGKRRARSRSVSRGPSERACRSASIRSELISATTVVDLSNDDDDDDFDWTREHAPTQGPSGPSDADSEIKEEEEEVGRLVEVEGPASSADQGMDLLAQAATFLADPEGVLPLAGGANEQKPHEPRVKIEDSGEDKLELAKKIKHADDLDVIMGEEGVVGQAQGEDGEPAQCAICSEEISVVLSEAEKEGRGGLGGGLALWVCEQRACGALYCLTCALEWTNQQIRTRARNGPSCALCTRPTDIDQLRAQAVAYNPAEPSPIANPPPPRARPLEEFDAALFRLFNQFTSDEDRPWQERLDPQNFVIYVREYLQRAHAGGWGPRGLNPEMMERFWQEIARRTEVYYNETQRKLFTSLDRFAPVPPAALPDDDDQRHLALFSRAHFLLKCGTYARQPAFCGLHLRRLFADHPTFVAWLGGHARTRLRNKRATPGINATPETRDAFNFARAIARRDDATAVLELNAYLRDNLDFARWWIVRFSRTLPRVATPQLLFARAAAVLPVLPVAPPPAAPVRNPQAQEARLDNPHINPHLRVRIAYDRLIYLQGRLPARQPVDAADLDGLLHQIPMLVRSALATRTLQSDAAVTARLLRLAAAVRIAHQQRVQLDAITAAAGGDNGDGEDVAARRPGAASARRVRFAAPEDPPAAEAPAQAGPSRQAAGPSGGGGGGARDRAELQRELASRREEIRRLQRQLDALREE